MKNVFVFLILTVGALFINQVGVAKVYAADGSYSLSPSGGNFTVGSPFGISVRGSSGTHQINAFEVHVRIPRTLVSGAPTITASVPPAGISYAAGLPRVDSSATYWDILLLGSATSGPVTIAANTQLFSFQINPTAAGSLVLSLPSSLSYMIDTNGSGIPMSISGGTYTIGVGTVSNTPTRTLTRTPTRTPTTAGPTSTRTPTRTPTTGVASATRTPTRTPTTGGPTATRTATRTPTRTPTTGVASATRTPTRTRTPSATAYRSPTRTVTQGGPSLTRTRTPSRTATRAPSNTPDPATSPTPTDVPSGLPGDINNDRVVNSLDYVLLFENYTPNPITDPRADINGDTRVNALDYTILFENFGLTLEVYLTGTPTPAP